MRRKTSVKCDWLEKPQPLAMSATERSGSCFKARRAASIRRSCTKACGVCPKVDLNMRAK